MISLSGSNEEHFISLGQGRWNGVKFKQGDGTRQYDPISVLQRFPGAGVDQLQAIRGCSVKQQSIRVRITGRDSDPTTRPREGNVLLFESTYQDILASSLHRSPVVVQDERN